MSGESAYNAAGVVSLSFAETGLERLVAGIQEVRDATPDAVVELDALEKVALGLAEQMQAATAAQREMAASLEGTNGATAKGAAEWKAYTAELEAANKAYLDFRKGQVTGGGGGTPLTALTAEQKAQYLDTGAVQGDNILKGLRDEQVASAAAAEAASKQTAIYNQYLYDEAIAAERAAAAEEAHGVSLSTLRHSLFDASTTLAAWGIGLLAIPVLSAKVASDFQKDFAGVSRALVSDATPAQLGAIKQSLIDLSEQVPISFADLTKIATAGAQMGIGAAGLLEFTRVVAELTVTTNVTTTAAENMLQKFMIIGGVAPSQFEALASAMLNVSIHTGATEAQISLLSTRILGVATEAGFTTPQVIGLAAAFSSVSAQSATYELGTITRFLGKVEGAATDGGSALTLFAKTAGVSTEAVQSALKTQGAFAPVFVDFIDGLDKVQKSGGSVREILNELGITSIRDISALENLANAHKILHTAMDDAAAGWANQTILAQHYNVVADTLSSKTKEMGNTFMAFMNQVGSASTGPLSDVVGFLGDILKNLTDFAGTGAGEIFLVMGAGAAVLLGSLALLGSGLSAIGAGVAVMKQAWDSVSGSIGKAQASVALFAAEQQAAVAGTESLTAEQAALMDATGGTTSKFGSLVSMLGGPLVLGVTAGVVAIGALTAGLEAARASSSDLQNALSTGSSQKITTTATQGDDQRNFIGNVLGDQTTQQSFANLHASLANSAADWRDYWKGMTDPSNANFISDTKRIGDELSKLASSNLPGAQAGFAALAEKTNGSETDLWRLISVMPAYKDALTQQLTAAGEAATKQNILRLALGSTGDAYLATAGQAAIMVKSQQDVTTELTNITGSAKALASLEDSYGKAASTFYDLKTVIGEVQSASNDAAQAQADAVNAGGKTNIAAGNSGAASNRDQAVAQAKAIENQNLAAIASEKSGKAKTAEAAAIRDAYNAAVKGADATEAQTKADVKAANGSVSAKAFYDGQSVSLGQLTKQYQTNGAELDIWNQNLAIVTLKYGSTVADQFKAMGHNAVSESALSQLAAAAPAQGQAFADAMTSAMDKAGKAQADALIAAGHILTADGHHVGDATAAEIGKAMIAGEPITEIMKQYHLKWDDANHFSLAPPNTHPAQSALDQFFNDNNHRTLQFQAIFAQPSALPTGAPLKAPGGATGGYFDGMGFSGFSEGGYTGDGGKYQETGIVHGGEFVFSKVAVQRIGLENLAFQHNMAKQGYAEGGPVGGHALQMAGTVGGVVQVALTAYDRSLLEQIANQKLVMPSSAIQRTIGHGNVVANTRRSN